MKDHEKEETTIKDAGFRDIQYWFEEKFEKAYLTEAVDDLKTAWLNAHEEPGQVQIMTEFINDSSSDIKIMLKGGLDEVFGYLEQDFERCDPKFLIAWAEYLEEWASSFRAAAGKPKL